MSVFPAGVAGLSALRLSPIHLSDETRNSPDLSIQFRRNIQKHFLSSGLYLPLEDIIVVSDDSPSNEQIVALTRQACGPGNLYIWLPLRFRLPIWGDKVWEWCWKPTMKAANR